MIRSLRDFRFFSFKIVRSLETLSLRFRGGLYGISYSSRSYILSWCMSSLFSGSL